MALSCGGMVVFSNSFSKTRLGLIYSTVDVRYCYLVVLFDFLVCNEEIERKVLYKQETTSLKQSYTTLFKDFIQLYETQQL